MDSNAPTNNQPIFTIAELSRRIKQTIEGFGLVRVKAEISGCSHPPSGHVYFTLKDDSHVIDGVVWRNRLPYLNPKPEDGLEVIATGRLTTYSPRSRYQIIIESLEIAGEGAILKQLELRRKRLQAEGLFDEARKKPLPSMPRVIAVITSPKGAVIHDICHRLDERFPVHVLVWPVSVQGDTAASEVVAAIAGFNAMSREGLASATTLIPRPEILIIARGGGSLEDLMPFNDEDLVRAVADSKIPIISAVGHETDTTLCDYAADLRAPTPTAAAEKAVPVKGEIQHMLNHHTLALERRLDGILNKLGDRFASHTRLLTSPSTTIADYGKKLAATSLGLDRRFTTTHSQLRQRLAVQAGRLVPPEQSIRQLAQSLHAVHARMHPSYMNVLGRKGASSSRAGKLLEALSYKSVLQRGFVVVTDQASSKTIRRAQHTKSGQALNLHFDDGVVAAKVEDN